MKRYLSVFAAIAAAFALPVYAQNRMDFAVATTTGNGTLTTTITWAPRAPAPDPTSCTATGATQWAGPKAVRGTETITFANSATLNLECSWLGDSIVTFSWTNPTTNVGGSPYTDPKLVRIKHTFNTAAQMTDAVLASAQCGQTAGVVCTDVSQAPTLSTMRTVTGITQTGTLRAVALAINQRDVFSQPSNAATKVFTGVFTVTESVGIVVNPQPGPITSFQAT